jgi:hypothetical protein
MPQIARAMPPGFPPERNREIFGRRVYHGELQVEVSKIHAVSMEVGFLVTFR